MTEKSSPNVNVSDADYEAQLVEGPDFARHHGDSDFRDAPVVRLDRNDLAKLGAFDVWPPRCS
jgi:hypothetical protein